MSGFSNFTVQNRIRAQVARNFIELNNEALPTPESRVVVDLTAQEDEGTQGVIDLTMDSDADTEFLEDSDDESVAPVDAVDIALLMRSDSDADYVPIARQNLPVTIRMATEEERRQRAAEAEEMRDALQRSTDCPNLRADVCRKSTDLQGNVYFESKSFCWRRMNLFQSKWLGYAGHAKFYWDDKDDWFRSARWIADHVWDEYYRWAIHKVELDDVDMLTRYCAAVKASGLRCMYHERKFTNDFADEPANFENWYFNVYEGSF